MNRRDFLGYLTMGSAGTLLPTIVSPRPKVFDMGRRRKIHLGPPYYVNNPVILLSDDGFRFTILGSGEAYFNPTAITWTPITWATGPCTAVNAR